MSEQEKKQEEIIEIENVKKTEKQDDIKKVENVNPNIAQSPLLNEKKVDEIRDKMSEVLDRNLIEEVVTDNKIEFELDSVKYKVNKPIFRQKQEAYKKQSEYYIELLQIKDENDNFKYKSKEDLKKLYKARGVDIDKMESNFKFLETKKNNLQLKLGEALVLKASDEETEAYKKELEELYHTQSGISIQITQLYEYSLENKVSIYGYSYLTHLITEKFEDDKWVPLWKDYQEYLDSDEKLINQISFYVLLVTKDELET